ncbi:MAG: SPOR domain-containing protein [Brachymonas sp.]
MNPFSSSQSALPSSVRRHPASLHGAKQRGIGMIGFIVGIVVGLAVALAVAVYITKVPTPFTDKLGAKTAEQQAEEEARLKSWDPNGPLASKTPAPASSGYVQPAPTMPPVAGASMPGNAQPPAGGGFAIPGDREQELARARAEAEAKLKADLRIQELAQAKAKAEEARQQDEANASNDPIGALLQARNRQPNTAAPATQATTAEPFVYYVQVGAFRDHSGADNQKARLSMMGLNPRINERQQSGRTVYQVRLGPFNSKGEADSARARVESSGMETTLVRVQR